MLLLLLDDARTDAARRENEVRERTKLEVQVQQLQQQLAVRAPIGAMSVSVSALSVNVATLSFAPTTATVIETDNTDDVVTQPVSDTGNVGIGSAIRAPVDVNIGQSVGLTAYPSAERMYTTSVPADRTITSRQVNAPTYTNTAVGLVTDTQVQPAAVAALSSITGVQPQGTGISGRAVMCTSVVSTRPEDTQPQDTGLIQLPPATGLTAAAAQPPPSSVFGSNVTVLDEQSQLMSGRTASQYGFQTDTLATGNAFGENIFSENISFADNSLLAAANTTLPVIGQHAMGLMPSNYVGFSRVSVQPPTATTYSLLAARPGGYATPYWPGVPSVNPVWGGDPLYGPYPPPLGLWPQLCIKALSLVLHSQ